MLPDLVLKESCLISIHQPGEDRKYGKAAGVGSTELASCFSGSFLPIDRVSTISCPCGVPSLNNEVCLHIVKENIIVVFDPASKRESESCVHVHQCFCVNCWLSFTCRA